MKYNDPVEPPNPRVGAVCFLLAGVLGLPLYACEVGRDAQRHRFDGMHVVGLLLFLGIAARIGQGLRRVWRKRQAARNRL